MSIKREDLKVCSEYLSQFNTKLKILFIGKDVILVERYKSDGPAEELWSILTALETWKNIPKPKKRYWIWDVREHNRITTSFVYVDERGYNTINQLAYNPDRLLFKHKKRWIDIDSDGNVYHNEGDTE